MTSRHTLKTCLEDVFKSSWRLKIVCLVSINFHKINKLRSYSIFQTFQIFSSIHVDASRFTTVIAFVFLNKLRLCLLFPDFTSPFYSAFVHHQVLMLSKPQDLFKESEFRKLFSAKFIPLITVKRFHIYRRFSALLTSVFFIFIMP